MSTRRAGLAGRLLRPRRTVRWRMTLLYGALFLVSGAILLVIASGVASVQSASSAQASIAQGGGQQPAGRAHGTVIHGPTPIVHQLLVGSLIALAVMAFGSALLGWFMAGHALRPLRTITATARRISEDNLHERLGFTGPDDELKQLADTIDELLERLEGAFAAQRRFVANASHELRTPLATMRASLDVAEAKREPSPAHSAALNGRLRAELDRIDDLLEGLLALARAQHRALPERAVVSLGRLTAAALAAHCAAAALAAVTIRRGTGLDGTGLDGTGLDGRVPDATLVDGSQALIGRMIDNLLDNAIVHNEPGGWMSVSVQVIGPVVRLTVENGGVVLQSAQVDQLAQPFRRLGADRTGSDQGSGLGLSIVAAVAAAHGGALDLRARPDGGLTARIELPLARHPVPAVLAGVRQ